MMAFFSRVNCVCRGAFLAVVVGMAIVLTGDSVQATLISTISDAGFESVTSGWSSSGLVSGAPTGWTQGVVGVSSPSTDTYSLRKSAADSANQAITPDPTEGLNQVMMIVRHNGTPAGQDNVYLYQSLGTIDASAVGSLITVSVDTAARSQASNVPRSATARIGIYTGTTATSLGTEVSGGGTGSMRTLAVNSSGVASTYTNGTISDTLNISSDLVGSTLYLAVSALYLSSPGGVSDQYVFDNVTYTTTPAPEPGSLLLLATGLIGLLAYAWRKRK